MTPRLAYTKRGAARCVGLSDDAFMECVEAGQMPQPIMIGHYKRWRHKDLEAALEKQNGPDTDSAPDMSKL